MKRLVFLVLACVIYMVGVGQNLTRIEYFIDTDPGYGSATSVSFTAAASVTDLTFAVSLTNVSDGFHTLNVRSQDANNKWSLVQSRPFFRFTPGPVDAPAISRIEYYIDTDPGYGAGTSVTFTAGNAVTDLAFSVPLGSVADGFHTLFVRTKDANNKWSLVQSRPFFKAAVPVALANINRIEYFIDTDPGYGAATSVTFTASPSISDLVFNVDVSAASQGAHKLYVRSRDANNKWSLIQLKDFSVCNQPSPVAAAATAITTTGFTANWAAAAGAASYTLDVSADNFATFVSGFSAKSVTATTQAVTGLTAGTAYSYRVSAVNATCTSVASNVISATTLFTTPTASAASAITSSGFTANWVAVTSATGYQLDISTDNFATFITGYSSKAISGTSEVVAGLSAGTTYQYRVRATNGIGVSMSSSTISVTTAPAAPVAIAATAIGTTSFTANWNAVTGATGYKLDVSKDNFTTFVSGFSDKAVTGTTSIVTGLTVGTAYKYRVRATNTGGASANSNSIDVTTLSTPAPVAIAATLTTTTGFTANWNAVTGATGYKLDVSADNFVTFVTGFNDKAVTGTTSPVTGLTPATAYKYRVRAVDANGTSVSSNAIDVSTLAQPVTPAPVALAATLITTAGFTANWNAVTSATGYKLDVSADNFATFVTGFNDKAVTATTSAVTGLALSTAYKYRVRTVDANGTSANSNVIDVTTLAKQNQTITFAALPDKLITDNPFTLTATASSNLAVAYTTTSDKITIAGSQVTLVKAGRASITANQAGNDSFNAATAVTQSFCIKPAKPTVTLSNTNTEAVTLTSSASAGNQWYFAGTAIAGATNATLAVTAPGIYKVQVKADDCTSEFSADQTVIVTGDIKLDGSSISISPNPVDDVLQLNGIVGEIKSNHLFDMTGRVAAPLTLEKKNEVYQASVDQLSSGVYLLRILQENKVVQVKFVKK